MLEQADAKVGMLCGGGDERGPLIESMDLAMLSWKGLFLQDRER